MITAMLRLAVIAHPGARQERVDVLDDDALGVWVRPGQSKAGQRGYRTRAGQRPRLASATGALAAGQTSRRKIVEIDLPDFEVLRARLVAHAVRSG